MSNIEGPRAGLAVADRRLVLVACHAVAVRVPELESELQAALANDELTIDELLEFVLHLAVYAGWPRAAQAEISVRHQWHRHHADRGVVAEPFAALEADSLGPDSHAERIAAGEAKWEEVNLFPPATSDSPYFQLGLISFAFGQVWTRPGLSRRQRRLITLPCVGDSDVQGALDAHVGSALGSGDLSGEDLTTIASMLDDAGSVDAATRLRTTVAAKESS